MPRRFNRRSICRLAIAVAIALCGRLAIAQGFAPDEAVRRMTLPDGVVVQTFAAEPTIRQPVAMEFDERGRLWVIQYLQYPNPAGLERVEVDRYSRTKYDRVPEPPPRGPHGADRITILEDSDRDGRADSAHDFVDGLNLASGLAFGHGGVYVLQTPYLLFYPDENRDDRPDGDPRVLLTGFGMEDAHSVANSLTWGPDGWLYGAQGSTVTANIRGVEFQQGVWRYHPPTDRFELFYEGGGNTWGLDFDAEGNLFASTNVGGVVALHGVQGGYYWKSFGKHGALHNPHAYGYFEHMPHANFRGGHVTVGGIIYQGHTLPEMLRGKYVAGDLLGHAVYWHDVAPNGSTFRTAQGGDLLLANDTWFATSDVTSGPDGAIYVADWHDARTAHPDPDAEWDRSNGRVYAIRGADAVRGIVFDNAQRTSAELVELLANDNDWYRRTARRLLADRRDPIVIEPLKRLLHSEDDSRLALQYFWAINVSGGFDEALALELLDHREAVVRAWAVRLLGDECRVSPPVAERFARLAESDPSVRVRSQLASTAGRWPADVALPILARLAAHAEDADDPFVPLLLWWAIEAQASKDATAVVELMGQPSIWSSPLAGRELLPRLARRVAAEGDTAGLQLAARLIVSAPDAEGRIALVESIGEALAGRRLESVPSVLTEQLTLLWADEASRRRLANAAVRFGYQPALDWVREQAMSASASDENRVVNVELLAATGADAAVGDLLALAIDEPSPAVRVAAMRGLARFDDPRVRDALLSNYTRFDSETSAAAREVLFGRADWALAFLAGVEEGRYSAADASSGELARLALHRRDDIDALVRQHWGTVAAATPEERLAVVRRLNNDLRAGTGDAIAGRLLFREHCGKCHALFGEGEKVGPELTTANRHDRQYLLVSMVDPSSVVRKEYLSHVLATTDGRVLTGLLVEETPSTVTLLDAENRRHTIPRGEIDSLEASSTSLMPERLLEKLSPQQLRDLFSYLQAEAPP